MDIAALTKTPKGEEFIYKLIACLYGEEECKVSRFDNTLLKALFILFDEHSNYSDHIKFIYMPNKLKPQATISYDGGKEVIYLLNNIADDYKQIKELSNFQIHQIVDKYRSRIDILPDQLESSDSNSYSPPSIPMKSDDEEDDLYDMYEDDYTTSECEYVVVN